MLISQRQAALGILAVLLIGLLPPTIIGSLVGAPPLAIVLNCLLIGLSLLIGRGLWRDQPAAYPALVLLSVANSVIAPPTSVMSSEILLVLLLPPVVALIVGRPHWLLLAAVATPLLFAARAWGQPLQASPTLLALYITLVIGLLIARLVVDTALQRSNAHARELEQAKAGLEAHALELTRATERQAEQLADQRRLLDLVATLEISAITLADGVLLVPVIGQLDTRRAQLLTSHLLERTHEQRARLVILDLAALSVIDTAVAQALLATARALRLLGCRVMLSGISASVASTITHLNIPLNDLDTVRSPQEALERAAG